MRYRSLEEREAFRRQKKLHAAQPERYVSVERYLDRPDVGIQFRPERAARTEYARGHLVFYAEVETWRKIFSQYEVN